MASIGAGWADNSWRVASWVTAGDGAWVQGAVTPPAAVAETGKMRTHFIGYAGFRRR